MKRFQYSLFAAAGILILAFVLTATGPKRVMAALGYTPVRDVDQPARQPYVQTFVSTITSGLDQRSVTLPPPPIGKRLVIESLSGFFASGFSRGSIELHVSGPSQGFYELPLSFLYTDTLGTTTFAGQQLLRAYVGATDTVTVTATQSDPSHTSIFHGTVTGYLVDLP